MKRTTSNGERTDLLSKNPFDRGHPPRRGSITWQREVNRMHQPTFFSQVGPAAPPPSVGPSPFAPQFGPFQPVPTFMPVIRPVVGLTPQEALIGGLALGALLPTAVGQGLTLFGVPGASTLAGQLRALGFFTGLAVPPAFLFRPQPPPVTPGTIPFPAPVPPFIGPLQPIHLRP